MAKFSVERDEEENEEGPSSNNIPKHKKQKITSNKRDEDKVPREEDNHNLVKSDREEGSFSSSSSSSIYVTLIEPEVLDCSVCMEPLTPPIFQCENGHIACSLCSPKPGTNAPPAHCPLATTVAVPSKRLLNQSKYLANMPDMGARKHSATNRNLPM